MPGCNVNRSCLTSSIFVHGSVCDIIDYSVYVSRQASRRSWRIGQTRPVKVVYMAHRSTLQADALKLVAQKMQSSLAVEGELPEVGLAAFEDDGDDMMMALARKIVNGEEDEAGTVEEVFARLRDAEADAEGLLVDDGWKAVAETSVTFSGEATGARLVDAVQRCRGRRPTELARCL